MNPLKLISEIVRARSRFPAITPWDVAALMIPEPTDASGEQETTDLHGDGAKKTEGGS